MSFPCESYESFAEGKCTRKGGEKSYVDLGNASLPSLKMGFAAQDYYNFMSKKESFDGTEMSGKYFLQTNEEPPYCRFHYQIKIVMSGAGNELKNKKSEESRLHIRLHGRKGSTSYMETTKEYENKYEKKIKYFLAGT